MTATTVENVYTRQLAKEVTKKHFWKLVGMNLLVTLIVFGVMLAGMLLLFLTTGISLESVPSGMGYSSYAAPSASVGAAFSIGYFVLMLVITLVGSGLGMGLYAAMIDLCRGDETVTVGRIFSRMKYCLKAFGLSLWIGLKVFLWMLPGYIAMFVMIFATAGSDEPAVSGMLALLGMILIFALVIPAAYRYMLSTYLMADEPGRGIRESVNLSKQLMKGHKWQAFKLIVPVFLVMLGLTLLASLVLTLITALVVSISETAGAIITVVLMIFPALVSLYFSIRMELCYCVFYLRRREELDACADPAEPQS
ncbi:MAG: DUF975 family protein [Clostridia bacterium]|nr:DUF975 family protein [Clostridia bacterium]